MKFYDPKTISVSLTGRRCTLMCEYCKGHYLQSMISSEDLKAEESSENSYLISGGFDKLGRLPLYENKEFLLKLNKQGRLNIHPGFLREEDLELLKELEPVVSFDFIQDSKLIREVNHLPYTPLDYLNQYKSMVDAGLKVVPHILLGLGEKDEETLEKVAELNPEKAVLLIFRPTRNTPLKKREPPELTKLARIWERFRENYHGELILGCMRPGGNYRVKADYLAQKIGFDGIVKPAKPVKDALAKEATTTRLCCAF
ncbi:MAG: hypothetical protein PHC96_08445 [Firmicutes bacterium]|nr:hypothetical protein [Bacillota bacterium]